MKIQTKTLTPELLHKKPDAVNEKELTMKANALTPDLLHKMNAKSAPQPGCAPTTGFLHDHIGGTNDDQ